MSPLGRYLIYCDHGFPVGGDCWRCWQRRALDAEADVRALALSALDYLDHAHRDSNNLRHDLARPSVRKLLEEQP